jgi:threonine/homoserine efflux transporter RhtA
VVALLDRGVPISILIGMPWSPPLCLVWNGAAQPTGTTRTVAGVRGHPYPGRKAGGEKHGSAAVAGMIAALLAAPVGALHARGLNPKCWMLGVAVGIISSAIPTPCRYAAPTKIPSNTFDESAEPAIGAIMGFILLKKCCRSQKYHSIRWCVVAGRR